jgi:hypothetical protein
MHYISPRRVQEPTPASQTEGDLETAGSEGDMSPAPSPAMQADLGTLPALLLQGPLPTEGELPTLDHTALSVVFIGLTWAAGVLKIVGSYGKAQGTAGAPSPLAPPDIVAGAQKVVPLAVAVLRHLGDNQRVCAGACYVLALCTRGCARRFPGGRGVGSSGASAGHREWSNFAPSCPQPTVQCSV